MTSLTLLFSPSTVPLSMDYAQVIQGVVLMGQRSSQAKARMWASVGDG